MTTFTLLALLVLGAGCMIIIHAIASTRERAEEFPRHRTPVTTQRRMLPIVLGAVLFVAGAGMLLVSQTRQSSTAPESDSSRSPTRQDAA